MADDLYGLAPQEFIPARGEAVAAAKASGDKELAAEIGKLGKPTVAAWLVNLLVREQPEQVEQFVALGNSLREAAESLDGDELKQLNKQRRQIVLALVRQATALGRAQGQRASASVEDEIRETLEASLADPAVGEEVLAGRLAKSVKYAGFGGEFASTSSVSSGASGSSGAAPRRPAGSARSATATAPSRAKPAAESVPDLAAMRLARARQALEDAERGVRRAERERDAEAGRMRAAEARRDDIEAKVTRMRAELAELEGQLDTANATLSARVDDLAKADTALTEAGNRRSKAADELSLLSPE